MTEFGHTQISVPKIGIKMLKTACINLWTWQCYVLCQLVISKATPVGVIVNAISEIKKVDDFYHVLCFE